MRDFEMMVELDFFLGAVKWQDLDRFKLSNKNQKVLLVLIMH
jgi:hypothetical protein